MSASAVPVAGPVPGHPRLAGVEPAPGVVRLDGVWKAYRRGSEEVPALAGADLSVSPGETVAVVGRSGSGKSTLLHLAGAIDKPDRGTVQLAGRDLAELSPEELARMRRHRVGFVFQFFHLLPTLTVGENVGLPFVLDRRPPDTHRVEDLLEALGIAHRARHRPAELSGGELQRAAIARALVMSPSVVLADEPTGNLDSKTAQQVLEVLLQRVAQEHSALVLVTHDRSAARRADRVLTLRDGRIR